MKKAIIGSLWSVFVAVAVAGSPVASSAVIDWDHAIGGDAHPRPMNQVRRFQFVYQ